MELVAQAKKYDIKSGIITFETTMKIMGMAVTNKSVVYFDEYGTKECKETYSDGTLKESFFSDGKNLYKVSHDQKTAWKTGPALRGTEFRFDWNEISEKDKKAGKAKQLGKITVAGKECESFEYKDRGSTTTYAGWSHICLLTDLTSKDMNSIAKAVRIEENARVPAEKFSVPAGYTVK
jgi:hypothetical protein